eukprot:10080292-Prorocentrum_lima.AAC.1
MSTCFESIPQTKKQKNVVVLVCVDVANVWVLFVLNPGGFKLAHLYLGVIAIVLLEDVKQLLVL